MSSGGGAAGRAVRGVLVALLCSAATVHRLQAQEPEGSEGEANAEEEYHANHIALFLGSSTTTEEVPEGSSATSFTLGADYERRLSGLIGLGLLVDFAIGDFERTALLGVPLFVHPVGGLRLVAAPAVEFASEAESESPDMNGEAAQEESSERESETGFAFRLGVGYEFELGERWSLAPEFNTDFISGKSATLVYGLSLGLGF